jgi:hypothetical protein
MSANNPYTLTEIRYLELLLNAKHGICTDSYVFRFGRVIHDENRIDAYLFLLAPTAPERVRSLCRQIYVRLYDEVTWQAFFWLNVTGNVSVYDRSSDDLNKHSAYEVKLDTSENLFAKDARFINMTSGPTR